MPIAKILIGHVSPETAYMVDDYPYGFTLRCKIRYWLEFNKNGARLCSQTTNPKRAGEWWNTPKKSTYMRFGGCMFLDENGHVHWSGIGPYSTADETQKWIETYGAGNVLPRVTDAWLKMKRLYESKRGAAE